MSLKVLKFGGSSLSDANQFQKVAAIVRAEEERRYIVPSAPGKRYDNDTKVTDLLYACHDAATKGDGFDEVFSRIEKRFNSIITDLGLTLDLSAEFTAIRRNILDGASVDYAASRGEYLSGMVLASLLDFPFVGDCVVMSIDGLW